VETETRASLKPREAFSFLAGREPHLFPPKNFRSQNFEPNCAGPLPAQVGCAHRVGALNCHTEIDTRHRLRTLYHEVHLIYLPLDIQRCRIDVVPLLCCLVDLLARQTRDDAGQSKRQAVPNWAEHPRAAVFLDDYLPLVVPRGIETLRVAMIGIANADR